MAELVHVIDELIAKRALLANERQTVGLVPTMGALHLGHLSLVERAASDNDVVVVSIFVNPLQFGSVSDLEHYPRQLQSDLVAVSGAGADLVFAPSEVQMFPFGTPMITVDPGSYGTRLEGISRPGHMRGVATIVTKLLSLVRPDRAYFGEKDYEQLTLIRRLEVDLGLGVEIVGMPIVREKDGLAMSSRNQRLNDKERQQATVLYRAISHGAELLATRSLTLRELELEMVAIVHSESDVTLDYATARSADDLSVPEVLTGALRLVIAGTVGPVRLIDNISVTV